MDILELKRMSQSLSLSILAMCLLNGEILHNGVEEEDPASMSGKTVSQYLKAQAFKEFCAPRSELDLTFNKGCRFVDVQLKKSGIKTTGHLWKLGRIIHTARFRLPLSRERPSCSPVQDKKGRLAQLVAELRLVGETSLATQIERFLSNDSTRSDESFKSDAFPKRYMKIMAEELAVAIENGRSLRLGQIWSATQPGVPCSAIFIWDSSRIEERNIGDNPHETNTRSKGGEESEDAFAFTSTSPKEPGY